MAGSISRRDSEMLTLKCEWSALEGLEFVASQHHWAPAVPKDQMRASCWGSLGHEFAHVLPRLHHSQSIVKRGPKENGVAVFISIRI